MLTHDESDKAKPMTVIDRLNARLHPKPDSTLNSQDSDSDSEDLAELKRVVDLGPARTGNSLKVKKDRQRYVYIHKKFSRLLSERKQVRAQIESIMATT